MVNISDACITVPKVTCLYPGLSSCVIIVRVLTSVNFLLGLCPGVCLRIKCHRGDIYSLL